MSTVDAKQFVDLLASRHSKDVFVPECKDGPTHGGSHRRMDAWAMAKSWANPCIDAYEIKVSRSDFVNDNKLQSYMAYCNRFWIVCPSHMINPDEVPENCGLIWASKTMTRLYSKKVAAYRPIDPAIMEPVYQYILMCRTRIRQEYEHGDRFDDWKDWLERKAEHADVGHKISQRLRSQVADEITKVNNENIRLKSAIERYAKLEAFLEANDLSIHSYRLHEDVQSLLEGALPPLIERSLADLEHELRQFRERFERQGKMTRARVAMAAKESDDATG